MKNIYILLFSAIILSACSSSKEEIKLGTLNQKPCRSEKTINSTTTFTGETADNLVLYQQGNAVFASMDVRTYCNSNLSFDFQKDGDRVKLKVKNNNPVTDSCVCLSNVTTSVENLEPGSYTILVTNAGGDQLLTQGNIQIKK